MLSFCLSCSLFFSFFLLFFVLVMFLVLYCTVPSFVLFCILSSMLFLVFRLFSCVLRRISPAFYVFRLGLWLWCFCELYRIKLKLKKANRPNRRCRGGRVLGATWGIIEKHGWELIRAWALNRDNTVRCWSNKTHTGQALTNECYLLKIRHSTLMK